MKKEGRLHPSGRKGRKPCKVASNWSGSGNSPGCQHRIRADIKIHRKIRGENREEKNE